VRAPGGQLITRGRRKPPRASSRLRGREFRPRVMTDRGGLFQDYAPPNGKDYRPNPCSHEAVARVTLVWSIALQFGVVKNPEELLDLTNQTTATSRFGEVIALRAGTTWTRHVRVQVLGEDYWKKQTSRR